METYHKIKELLKNTNYKEIHHKETPTSIDSARERGEDISIGGKALLLKTDDMFQLFIISASKQLDSKKIKKELNIKSLRFATPQELKELTNLVPGSVPPFGNPVIDFNLYIDTSITENEKIAFNAGSLTDSIILKTKDYLNIANPTKIFNFSK
ncbi:hypothetical protein JXM83_01945 [Candidatus Woesearchaeota archaeon]|nr:hypothetical protein [Candidatus Woesearchaeota archaeon]